MEEKEPNFDLDQKIAANPNKFPVAVYFIVPYEVCERFSFIGVKVLFNQYLKNAFGMEIHRAKSFVHLFSGLIYLCPIFGAALSDSYRGKYHTIVYLSLPFLVGYACISLFSVPGVVWEFGKYPAWSFVVSSFLIAIGTGAIKPCVSSHGGDQFLPSQARLMDLFFSLYYVSVKIGGLTSQSVTPYVKEYDTCFNQPCYSLAYAIPTVLSRLTFVLFIIGERFYRADPSHGEFLPWQCMKLTSFSFP